MTATTRHHTLKEKQRRERADLILHAAEEILIEKGFALSSIDEIAARVGIAKSTVYLYFPSKEELVLALFERQLDLFINVVIQICSSQESARTRIERLLQHVYQALPSQRVQLLLSLATSIEVRNSLLDKREQWQERKNQLKTLLAAVLEQGKASGEFHPTLSTSVMLSTLFCLLSPFAYRQMLDAEPMTPEELAISIGHIFFEGIAAPQTS